MESDDLGGAAALSWTDSGWPEARGARAGDAAAAAALYQSHAVGLIRVAYLRPAAASAQPKDPFAVDEDPALAELELAWSDGGYHGFTVAGGTWGTISSAGEVLTGGTPDALNRAIRAHWQAMRG